MILFNNVSVSDDLDDLDDLFEFQHMNVKHVSKRTKKQGHRYGPSWICRNSKSVFAHFSFMDLLI